MNSLATTIDTRRTRNFVPATKLRPPQPRAEHFWRPQLFERLDVASARPVTLISAPTGFGKTTLLSTWASLGRRRIAWLTISKSDSDTVRLMSGIIAALRRAGAAVGDDVDRDLAAPGIDVADQVLPRLLDALDGDDAAVLVLDDFHLLRGASAHELVATLLADMPDSLRVIISTRADPVMPLGRLRATGALAEIRADQLRFDVGEADRFLNGSLRLDLDRESVETLEARTEGWPAGLYLAALTLQGRSDRAERARFVREFAGSSHHVVDYLSIEVMQGLSPDDRAFLLRTSILGRMNGPLCDAVAGTTGSAARLLALEKANLFIIPLDDTGTWFRFHRLFAELLRANLATEPRELELELHRRAAAWHADLGSTEAAVEHALAAGDREWAATLLARTWRNFARTGEFQTFDRLITSTGADRGRLAGPLAAVEAMMAGLMGRDPTVVGRLVATAEASGWEGPTPDGHSIDSLVAIATAAFCADDLERQKAAANRLIRDYPGVPELEGSGRASLGMVLAIQGDAGGAIEVLEPIDRLSDYPNIELYAAAARSLATMELGDPVRAEALARAALRKADDWGLSASRVGGALWLALGSAVARRSRPREALPSLERALSQWGVKGTVHRAAVLIELASALGATGEPGKARSAAREAREVLVAIRNAGAQPARLAAVERRLRMGVERAIPQGDVPSEAETRVLRLMSSPLSAREIAGELYISINTVKTHTKSLHMKLGTSSREETVARARELGLL